MTPASIASLDALEQLTDDHRVIVSSQQSYLGRALGINPQIEIDYRAVTVEKGDLFLLATDGVYEHVSSRFIAETINKGANELDGAARTIVEEAKRRGSPDNLTIQIVRIDELPDGRGERDRRASVGIALPPLPEARMVFDGYQIVRELHGSSRSHIYLAVDTRRRRAGRHQDSIDRPARRPRLSAAVHDGGMGRPAHRQRPCPEALHLQSRRRNYLYVVTEFVDGQTLTQWMIDNPRPDLETVRGIVEQIAKGLQAFHRLEMLHQDVRPDNIMIDKTGTAKIIDFGSTRMTGVVETAPSHRRTTFWAPRSTPRPNISSAKAASSRSDMFSLGVIAYQMLTGRLPYGTQIAKARTRVAATKAAIQTPLSTTIAICRHGSTGRSRKAVHPDPYQRYEELSEFVFDLRHPNKKLIATASQRRSSSAIRCCSGNACPRFCLLLFCSPWPCSSYNTASTRPGCELPISTGRPEHSRESLRHCRSR